MFSGFVFRGDTRRPEIIFQEGFIPTGRFDFSVSEDQRMDRMTGNLDGGFTFNHGVSTTLSTRIAQFYVKHSNPFGNKYLRHIQPADRYIYDYYFNGYIYLIDARRMAGYGISVPEIYEDQILLKGKKQRLLHEIYEVNFIHAIPNTSIVGAVWSDDHVVDTSCEASRLWMGLTKIKLTLGENPHYEGDAASVAKLFK